MLKVDVNKEHTQIEIIGALDDICGDIARMLSAINEKLMEDNPEASHEFRVMLTTGFMDGVCFNDDREHMEHYLAEGDARKKKNRNSVEDFVSFLKEKLAELEKFTGGDDDDEAE